MFNTQDKQPSPGEMFWIFNKRVIQENIFEIDYVIKRNLFFEKGNITWWFWEFFKRFTISKIQKKTVWYC